MDRTFIILAGGILPFGSVFIEMYDFFLASIELNYENTLNFTEYYNVQKT